MPPPILPALQRDPRIPAVLPRGCGDLVEFRADGWPVLLVIPADCGLLDPMCGYWHGAAAANDSPSAQTGA